MSAPLLVHLDANAEIGLGHAVRIGNLLKHLSGIPLILSGDCDAALPFLPENVVRVHASDADDLLVQARRHGAVALLVDEPDMARAIGPLRMEAPCPIAIIDDYGGIDATDLVINGTVLPAYHRYRARRKADTILTGGAFALIHDAFGRDLRSRAKNDRLLVVIGSGQAAFDWADFLLGAPVFSRWPHVTFVTGRALPDPERFGAACAALGFRHRHGISSDALAAEAHSATAGLTTGGMIVYEALAAGLPLAAFPQIANLEAEMNFFSRHGALLDLGSHGGFDAGQVAAALTTLEDEERRAQLSRNGRQLIDGQGLARAAKALEILIQSNGKRPA